MRMFGGSLITDTPVQMCRLLWLVHNRVLTHLERDMGISFLLLVVLFNFLLDVSAL